MRVDGFAKFATAEAFRFGYIRRCGAGWTVECRRKQAKTRIAEQLPDQVDIVNPGGEPWKDASSAAASDGCFTLRLVSIGLGLGVMSRRFCWKGKSSDLWGRKLMVQ